VDQVGNAEANGSITGASWVGSGPIGYAGEDALDFNGVSDRVTIADTTGIFNFGDGFVDRPFTVHAWVNMDDATNFRIVGKSNEWLLSFDASDKLRLSLFDGSASDSIDVISVDTYTSDQGDWVLYSATYNGLGSVSGMKLYRNGVLLSSTTSSTGTYITMEDTGNNLYFGTHVLSEYANGKIGTVGIFNTQQSVQDIFSVYALGAQGYVNDLSGNSNHAQISGAAYVGDGYFGYPNDDSLSFDGTGDVVNVGDLDALDGVENVTISGWATIDSIDATTYQLFGKYMSATHKLSLSANADGNMYASVSNGSDAFG
jgi:hypothetical protein